MDPIKTLAKALMPLIEREAVQAEADAESARQDDLQNQAGVGNTPIKEARKKAADAARLRADEVRQLANEVKMIAG